MKEFFQKLKIKSLEMIESKKKRKIIYGSCIGIILLLLIFGTKNGKENFWQKGNTEFSTEIDSEQILLEAQIKDDLYEVKHIQNQVNLFVNGEKKKNVRLDKLPIMEFNMNASTGTDDILNNSDADEESQTGGKVYRGKKIYAEQYLKYLKNNGYKQNVSIKTNGYVDIYLTCEKQIYRFLYIKKSEDSGALIFGKCDSKPDSINKIIKELQN